MIIVCILCFMLLNKSYDCSMKPFPCFHSLVCTEMVGLCCNNNRSLQFQYDYCQECFTLKGHLTDYIRIHTKEKLYISVNIARNGLHRRALWQITYGHKQKRIPISVNIARNVLQYLLHCTHKVFLNLWYLHV